MIHICIYTMEDINDSITMEASSPTVIDVIDLTKESPRTVRPSISRQRNTEDVPASYSITGSLYHRCRRPLSPIILGNMQNTQMENRTREGIVPYATSSNEVLTLDDTNEEDDKTYYTVESDSREPVPLTCPICLESLSSNLKPITTRCGHLFCAECLETFIRTSKECPTCKAAITLKSCTRLYL